MSAQPPSDSRRQPVVSNPSVVPVDRHSATGATSSNAAAGATSARHIPRAPDNSPSPADNPVRRVTPVTAGVPSTQVQENINQLQTQKRDLIKGNRDVLEALERDNLRKQGIAALSGTDGGTAHAKQELVITIEPPPDFQEITVFPAGMHPDIPPAVMEQYWQTALNTLTESQQHLPVLTAERKQQLEKMVTDNEARMVQLQAQLATLQAHEDSDGVAELQAQRNCSYSFQFSWNEGRVTVKSIPSPTADKVKSVYAAVQQRGGEAAVPAHSAYSNTARPARPAGANSAPVKDIMRQLGDREFPAVIHLGPAQNSPYTPVYKTGQNNPGDGNPGCCIASVDAGDQALYVGGSANNAAHAAAIPDAGDFQAYHRHMLTLPEDSRGYCVPHIAANHSPAVAYSLCKKANPATGAGAVFVHAFKEGQCPYGNNDNRIMLYLVPPLGTDYRNPEQFKAAVRATAKAAFLALQEYNVRAAQSSGVLPVVDVFRVCCFSSGVYKHDAVSTQQVAAAIHDGVVAGTRWVRDQGHRLWIRQVQYADGNNRTFSSVVPSNKP